METYWRIAPETWNLFKVRVWCEKKSPKSHKKLMGAFPKPFFILFLEPPTAVTEPFCEGRYLRNAFLARSFKVTCLRLHVVLWMFAKPQEVYYMQCFQCFFAYIHIHNLIHIVHISYMYRSRHIFVIHALKTLFPNTKSSELFHCQSFPFNFRQVRRVESCVLWLVQLDEISWIVVKLLFHRFWY